MRDVKKAVVAFATLTGFEIPPYKRVESVCDSGASGSRFIPGRLTTAYGLIRGGLIMRLWRVTSARALNVWRDGMWWIGRHGSWGDQRVVLCAANVESRRGRTQATARGNGNPTL